MILYDFMQHQIIDRDVEVPFSDLPDLPAALILQEMSSCKPELLRKLMPECAARGLGGSQPGVATS